MPRISCLIAALAALLTCGDNTHAQAASQRIVVQNYYYALPGKSQEVYELRLHASEVRASLGLPRGRVLRRAQDRTKSAVPPPPDVIWECEYPSAAAREKDVAVLGRGRDRSIRCPLRGRRRWRPFGFGRLLELRDDDRLDDPALAVVHLLRALSRLHLVAGPLARCAKTVCRIRAVGEDLLDARRPSIAFFCEAPFFWDAPVRHGVLFCFCAGAFVRIMAS